MATPPDKRKRDGSVRTVSQRMADYYAACGQYTALVQVYEDEAMVYAQVCQQTAHAIDRGLRGVGDSRPRAFDMLEGPTLSLDGSTWCWWLRSVYAGMTVQQLGGMGKHGTTPPDWIMLLMPVVYRAFRDSAPAAMARDEQGRVTLMHCDNRRLDASTVRMFADFLGLDAGKG